jgi:putative sigma-54 modulation protein
MQISVTFRNMEPSAALREYASDKVQRLKKYMAEPVDVHVVLAKHKYRNQAEVKVTSRGTVMKGVEHTEDMYSSIDLVMDKIERQARKHKDKIREFRPVSLGDEIMVRHGVVESAAAEEEEGPRIINTQEFSAKPMSVEEAVEQMNLMNNDFLVFLNASTQDVNVIYRRRDGNIGLIEAKTPRQE